MTEKPVALVTGGAGGIGSACCRALSAEGFHVGIHYRKSAEQAQEILSRINDGFLISADLTDIESVEAMVLKLKEKIGRASCRERV